MTGRRFPHPGIAAGAAAGVAGVLVLALLTAGPASGSAPTNGAAELAAAAQQGLVCTKTDKANGGFVLDCDPPVVATPSATVSASASPSPSATATTSPSPTATLSPSPSPSTSTTTTPPGNVACMAKPSACGYPDETNTGPMGATFTTIRNGNVTFTQPGVYSNVLVNGCVNINASNVRLEKSKVQGCGGPYAVRLGAGVTGVQITQVEVVMQGHQKGISLPAPAGAFIVRQAYVHGDGDCFGNTAWTEVRDSYCTIGPAGGDGPHAPNYFDTSGTWCDDDHRDGMEIGATTHTAFIHNTVRVPCGQTSAVQIDAWNGSARDIVISNNLMAGGAWTVYDDSRATGVQITNNRFSRWYFPGGGSATWKAGQSTASQACINRRGTALVAGNVWDGTGAAVTV